MPCGMAEQWRDWLLPATVFFFSSQMKNCALPWQALILHVLTRVSVPHTSGCVFDVVLILSHHLSV